MIRHKILLSAFVALAACSSHEEAEKQALVRAEGEHVVLSEPDKADFLKLATVDRDQGGNLLLPGRLVWNEERTVRIYPQLGGRIQKIDVDVGTSVKAGQVLARLASADYGEARADARKAEADLRVAEKALVRSKELREAGIIAEKDWQQSEAENTRARADAERAQRRLAGLGGDGDNYALKTPLAGVVVERNLNPGMEFRPDQSAAPLFVVTDPASLWLQLDAGEADLPYLKAGENIALTVKQFPGEVFKGTIRRVADFVDPQTRTIKVRCEVANPDRRLKAEMFAQASIVLPALDILLVPEVAVMLQGDRHYVLVAEGAGRFRRQLIETGVSRDGAVEVRSGLKLGDKVVVEGNLHLAKYFRALPAAGK